MRVQEAIDGFVERDRDRLIDAAVQFIKIPSVRGEALPGKPFGESVDQALHYALDLASQMGFDTRNLDGAVGYAAEVKAKAKIPEDRTPPTVELEKPAARRTTSEEPMLVLAATARDDVSMDRVEVFLNGKMILSHRLKSAGGVVREIPVQKALVLQEGENRVEVKAVDANGNSTSSDLVIVYRPR